MTEKQKLSIIYGICGLFILINAIFIANEFFWFMAVPLLGFLLLMYFTTLDKILLLITFLTPLSVTLSNYEAQLGLALPTEPLMVGVMVMFLYKIFYEQKYDNKIIRHPVSIAIIFYLLWMLLTSITSEFPLVSFKFFIAKLWFIIPFYFFATQVFKRIRNFKIFSWMYIISLCMVIVYTTFKHSKYLFDEDIGHWIMDPFYNDHTAYGAMIAFFVPVAVGFLFDFSYSNIQRFLTLIASTVIFIGLYLSYCRAAWLSVALALALSLILKLRIKVKWIVISAIIFIGLFFLMRSDIIMKLEHNKQDASNNLMEHIQSMSNISTDASNLERINRWEAAFRMFKARPFWGFGPGTYQFCYAPFQYSYERTVISTNAGNKGNAHSEYIGPLAESGVFGFLSVIAIAIATFYTALKVYWNTKNKKVRLLVFLSMLSLLTYYVHGSLNNFLDTDKASVPFWGFIAMIVALDVYHFRDEEKAITD
ncbi:MAG: O-antigen ligase family protein [Bacteroidetes bacterium]|nr:O-antigen ligase family protein [Bacteroidota bacterium]